MLNRITALLATHPRSLALAAGAVSATGFAPLGLWPAMLAGVAVLFALVAAAPGRGRAFLLGWLFALGQFVVGLNWIATAFTYQAAMPAWLGWVAVVLLSLYLAVWPGLATLFAWGMAQRTAAAARPVVLVLAGAGAWIVAEWLRSVVFTGFAWNPIAVALPFAAAPVAVIGTYGQSGLVVLVGGVLFLLAGRRWRAAGVTLAGIAALVGAATAWNGHRQFMADVARDSEGRGPRAAMTIVQPNVGQADKWEGALADVNFAKLARRSTAPAGTPPRLILWPEAAIPDYLETGYPPQYYTLSPAQARARLAAVMNPGDLMLLGALRLELDRSGDVVGARNSVFAVASDGTPGPRYDKAHLVPYGEYLPMRPLLSAIGLSRLAPGDLDFWPGPGPRTLDLGRFGRAGIQVCYEIIFSGQVVDAANRPDFIFNPSNDAWFGAWGPPQHLAQARLRAIEEGLPVIRSTPTGISAVIDATGRVRASLPLGVAGRIDADLPAAHAPTLFARFGNWLPIGFAMLLIVSAIAIGRRRR